MLALLGLGLMLAVQLLPTLGDMPPYIIYKQANKQNKFVDRYANDYEISEAANVKSQADQWAECHPEGLVLAVYDTHNAFAPLQYANGIYQYTAANLSMTLLFNDMLSKADTLESVREKFQSIAFDRIPIPGLTVPSRWTVSGRTPFSSFSKGVSITAYDGHHIGIHAESVLLDIRGKRNDIRFRLDSAMPFGTYFTGKRLEAPFTINADVLVHTESA